MNRQTSFDVRVFSILVYKGGRGRTYAVRWEVAGQRKRRTFKTRALADSFRSALLSAANRGEAFDIDTGEPQSMWLATENDHPWLDHVAQFAAMKWPGLASKSRGALADALASITMAMLP